MKFSVRSVDWDESWDDARQIAQYDAGDAVEAWCRDVDDDSGFVDGYPDGHVIEVRSETGIVERFTVSTDWDPSYFVQKVA